MVCLLHTKFHKILLSSFRGVEENNFVTHRQIDRWMDRTKTMSPHEVGDVGRHNARAVNQLTKETNKNINLYRRTNTSRATLIREPVKIDLKTVTKVYKQLTNLLRQPIKIADQLSQACIPENL